MAPQAAQRKASDPYQQFRFRLKCNGRYVAGVSKVSALQRSTEVVKQRKGGAPLPVGTSQYQAITLERGVSHDPAFLAWASQTWQGSSMPAADHDMRQNLTLEVYDEAGQRVLAYHLYGCWASEFQAQPELDGNTNAVAIHCLKLENQGWERDSQAGEPA